MSRGAPQLHGSRVLVVGLGRTGAAVARFAAGQGAVVTVTDRRPAAALQEPAASVPATVRLELGAHHRETFVAQDLIVLSPGVPEIPELTAARQAGVTVTGEIELASRFLDAPVAAITGTNGKSTVTSLCGAIVAAGGRPSFTGGNLGTPLIEALGTPAAGATGRVVVEVSSFQLETVERFRPRVAALLNLTPDHLDRYPSMTAYAEAKARIFQAQTTDDFAVVNADDSAALELAQGGRAQLVPFTAGDGGTQGGWIEGETLCLRLPGAPTVERYPAGALQLVGTHNRTNALAAFLCGRLLGATPEEVRQVAPSFRPLPHRMELVRQLAGVDYYDDSKGTNVSAVATSLSGFPRPVVLIAGGRDKGGDYGPLRDALAARGHAAVLIGEAAARLAAALDGVCQVHHAATLEEAVAVAHRLARPGDAVVLSPACSSFDMFRDYAHRAEVFRLAVEELGR